MLERPRKRERDPSGHYRWKVIREGECRVCHATGALDPHHLVPRSQGGDDTPDNIMPLCRRCHDGLVGVRWAEYASAVRRTMRPQEEAYVVGRKGFDWLDRRYPPIHQPEDR